MKKIISVFLLTVMMLTLLASCGGSGNDTTAADGSQSDVGTSDENGDKLVIDETTLDGYEYNVLVSGNVGYNLDYGSDFYFKEDATDSLSEAKHRWITMAEEKFDIDIVVTEKLAFGSCNGSGDGYKEIEEANRSGDAVYDSCMIGAYDVASLARNGYLADLNTFEYINLENSWWDQVANKDLNIQGKMYYTTGDISVVDNIFTHCVLFNKEMIVEKNLTNPYEYIENNSWTLDNFTTLVKQASDTSGEGTDDDNNVYGLLTWNDSMIQIMAAADERIASVNDSGMLELTMYNNRTQSLYSKWSELAFDSAYSHNYQTGRSSEDWDAVRTAIFDSNRALFYTTLFSTVVHHRDSETDFGIVPYPKFDEEQENYGHIVSSFHTEFFCIPYIHESSSISSSVSEYLAYAGQNTTLPAYYKDTLEGKYFRDEESFDMLDIIFESRVYDVAAYYRIGNISTRLGQLFSNQSVTLTQIYQENGNMAQSVIETINKNYAD